MIRRFGSGSGQVSFEFLIVFGWVLLAVAFFAGALVFGFIGDERGGAAAAF